LHFSFLGFNLSAMSTPLQDLYQHFGAQRALNKPHTAESFQKDNGFWYGLVKHGAASSTTLPQGFVDQQAALDHAAIAASFLNQQDEHLAANLPPEELGSGEQDEASPAA
jgi:hypothetical protein